VKWSIIDNNDISDIEMELNAVAAPTRKWSGPTATDNTKKGVE
jgi:hypothetical protein